MHTGYAALLLASMGRLATSNTFSLFDTFVGSDFFNGFTWVTIGDPTHGEVNFTDVATAQHQNLSYATASTFVMRADDQNVVPSGSTGRNSVRVISQHAYEDSVTVLDLLHMPAGCATWPAFWTLSQAGPWPNGGEIDIIEGVNLNTDNLATLHTTPDCTMPSSRNMSGTGVATDCDSAVNNNQGCGVSFTQSDSYGSPFNSAGGGYYVMERTQAVGVKVWFWARSDSMVPSGVKNGAASLNPDSTWGEPDAFFPSSSSCDFASHFNAHQIVFDLTFCGDWAGSVWGTAGCGSQSCTAFVANNPQAFSNAYWEINALRVYTSA